MLNRAVSSIFGPASPLRNEPTIDYNNTIYSNSASTYEPTIDSRFDLTRARRYEDRNNIKREYTRDNFPDHEIIRRNITPLKNEVSDTSNGILRIHENYNNIFENVYEDSDEELNTDFNSILHNITETDNKLTRTNNSLPLYYPGKFVKDYSRPRRDENGNEFKLRTKNGHNSYVDEQMKKLDLEISQERTTELNTKYNIDLNHKISAENDVDWDSIAKDIDEQNKFLNDLNNLIDLTNNESIPKNIQDKYEILKKDYLKELKNLENFYKAYYRLVVKYRTLKNKKKNPRSISLKEKVRLIKSTSLQLSIKNICDNLLLELQDNEDSIEYYKSELEKANMRIKELELQLSNKA